jgi:hypothetical protein
MLESLVAFLGNVMSIDKTLPYESFRLLCKQYGEIYLLEFPGMIPCVCLL